MWPITNHKNKNAFLKTIFMCLDIQKTYHQFLHTYSIPNTTPMQPTSSHIKKKPLPISHTNKFSFIVTKKIIPTYVVGRICLIQGSDIYNHNNDTKIIIGLRLDRSKLVRLTIWDNEAANFRELNHIFTRKNQS
ncbi:unnamed protein product [Brassica oleracea var. botrytis]